MTWKSEQYYPGGEIILEPSPISEWYRVIYRHPEAGDFFRGTKSKFELMADDTTAGGGGE